MKISRVLHAGYVFESGPTEIIFDPIFENPFSQNAHAFPNVKFDQDQIRALRFDAIFISHYHDDHCSFESLDLLDRHTPIFIFCLHEEMFAMLRDLGFYSVEALRIDQSVIIGEFVVTPRRALDADVDAIFQIQAEGLNVLNVVDAWIDDDTFVALAEARWDLILWPFQTMREIEVIAPTRASRLKPQIPAEFFSQLRALKPRYLIPSSCQFIFEVWSWMNHAFFPTSHDEFIRAMSKALPTTEVFRLDPSRSFALNVESKMAAAALNWVTPLGPQDVDYEFIEELVIPCTGWISQRLQPLDVSQSDDVLNYCHSTLVQKWRSFEVDEDGYFATERTWRLRLFDHLGLAQAVYYRICQNDIELLIGAPEKLNWTTDIPLAKVYAALHHGEALASMYFRINDFAFDEDIEVEMQTADVMHDPLIQCLFNGVFGGYQAAQLRKIKTMS